MLVLEEMKVGPMRPSTSSLEGVLVSISILQRNRNNKMPITLRRNLLDWFTSSEPGKPHNGHFRAGEWRKPIAA